MSLENVDVRLPAAARVRQHVEHGSLRRSHMPRAPSSRIARARDAPRSRGTTSAVESRSAAPARWILTIALASSSGVADAAIVPFTPSSTSSVAALSGPATTTTGTPRADASMTTRPYPSRRDGSTRHSAVASACSSTSPSTNPGAETTSVEPELGDRGAGPSRAPARHRRSRRGDRGPARAPVRAPGRAPEPASRGCAGPRRRRRPARAERLGRLERPVVLPLEARQLTAQP